MSDMPEELSTVLTAFKKANTKEELMLPYIELVKIINHEVKFNDGKSLKEFGVLIQLQIAISVSFITAWVKTENIGELKKIFVKDMDELFTGLNKHIKVA